MPSPADELRHEPAADRWWQESWYFDVAAEDGSVGAYVRVGHVPALESVWIWVAVVRDGHPLVLVRDHDVALPRSGLDVRGEGLWVGLDCEERLERWSVGVEAFGVSLDDPLDAYGGERGDRTAVGVDLEWEGTRDPYDYPGGVTRYEQPCRVSGELLVGTERIAIDAPGQRDHSWGVRDWWRHGWCWTAGHLQGGPSFHAVSLDVPGLDYQAGYWGSGEHGGFDVETQLGPQGLPTWATMRFGGAEVAVEPLLHAPVRLVDEAGGRATRFPRSLCRFTVEGTGAAGVGWTEWNQPEAPASR